MKKNAVSITLLTIVTAVILFLVFKPVLQHPNGILFSKSIDPLKSYYNFSYYLKHDSGIKHDGINYPYGDHLQYINSHPLYVTILKFVDKYIYPIANFGVAILNLSMILSFLIAMPFLYLILRRFKLPAWYSIIIALLIGFMNPQFDRIHGHFEMVYWFFIPMFWYLLIRWREEKKWFWGFLLVLSGTVGGFISAYFAAFYAIFLFGVLIADIWLNRKQLHGYLKSGLQLLILAIIPILLVKGLVGFTDWVDDRPYNPYGFYKYHASIQSIFFPTDYLFGRYNTNFEWEGRAYIGLPAAILALSIVLHFLYNLISKKKRSWSIYFQEKAFHPYLIAGTLVLLFSMCFPFKWGLGILLELLPPVKQFRALGRFSWIFFYIFTIYSAYFFYSFFQKINHKKALSAILLVAVIGIWLYDASLNVKRSTKNLFNKNDKLETQDYGYSSRFEESNIDLNQFQAILSLPFASTCGDKLLFEYGTTALVEAMKCSYHTGIPIVQSFSPRLSFSQALSSIQMLADSAIRKTRLDDMNEKPLLLICTKHKMNEQEKWLQSHASIFWEDQYISMSTLPVSVFKTSHQNWLNHVEYLIPELKCEGTICADTPSRLIYYDDFNEHESENSFSSEGAIYKRRGEIEVFNDKLPVDSGKVNLSFWLYFDTRRYDMPQPILHTLNENNELVENTKLNNRQVHDIYKNWVRISTQINAQKGFNYQLTVQGKYITIDDLLIKPENANVLIKNPEGFDLFNNFPLTKQLSN